MIALALAAVLALAVLSFGQLLRSQQRAHARREDLLLNQLLHAAGKPWQQAPADVREPGPQRPRYTATPEQYPTD